MTTAVHVDDRVRALGVRLHRAAVVAGDDPEAARLTLVEVSRRLASLAKAADDDCGSCPTRLLQARDDLDAHLLASSCLEQAGRPGRAADMLRRGAFRAAVRLLAAVAA